MGDKKVLGQYKKITHKERINVIYMREVHGMSFKQISKGFDIKYNSVRNILKAYNERGHTQKKRY